MKATKLFITAFLISCSLLLIGEINQVYLNNFNGYLATSFYKTSNIDVQTMLDDIDISAKRCGIQYFFSYRDVENTHSSSIYIFSDSDTSEYLDKYKKLSNKAYTSLFSGTTTVYIKSLNELPNDLDEYKCYIIGDEESAINFKSPLIDSYGGSFPKFDSSNSFKEALLMVIGVWCATFLVNLLINIYCQYSYRKEYFIKITLGTKKSSLVLKNILTDVSSYLLSFCILYVLFKNITSCDFMLEISIAYQIAFILSMIVVNIIILNSSVKESLSNNLYSKNLLFVNCCTKIIVSAISITLLSSSISVILYSFDFHKQEPFFNTRSDYYYVQFMSLERDVSPYNELYYDTHIEKSNIIMLDQNIELSDKAAVTANENSIEYLATEIPELSLYTFEKNSSYIIRHANDVLTAEDYYFLQSLAGSYTSNQNINEITYYEESRIIAFDNSSVKSLWVNNPTILLCVSEGQKTNSNEAVAFNFSKPLRMYNLLINTTEDDIKDFSNKNSLSYSFENIDDYYEYQKTIVDRFLIMNISIFLISIILHLTLLNTLLKMEYSINSMELSIKKTLGYSFVSRNNRIIIINLMSCLIGFVISYLLQCLLFDSDILISIISTCVLFVAELPLVFFKIYKFEKYKITNVLKGESTWL